MKITYKEKDYELKYSFRAHMIYENIMQKSFKPETLTDIINFFYASLFAVAKGDVIEYEEFLDWLDENPEQLSNFSEWLLGTLTSNSNVAPKANEETIKKTNKKAKKEDSKN